MDSPNDYDQTNSTYVFAHTLALKKARLSTVKAHLARKSSADWIDLIKWIFNISQNCAVWLFELFKILLTWAFSMLNPWTYLTQTNPEPPKSPSTPKFRLRSTESFTLTVPESFYLESTGFLKGAVVLAIVMALKVWAWPMFARWPWLRKPRAPRKPKQTQAQKPKESSTCSSAGRQPEQAAK